MTSSPTSSGAAAPARVGGAPGARGDGSDGMDAAVVAELRDPRTIRARCRHLLSLGIAGRLDHFEVRMDRLPVAAAETASVTRGRYPDLRVPVHGRMGHFDAGGIPRSAALRERLSPLAPRARARALFDVVVTSVLLDAGSGPGWRYRDGGCGEPLPRSEGLAVASLRWLERGALSRRGVPFEVDAERLCQVQDAELAAAFQVSADNPLAGVAGRAQLLRALGDALSRRADLFGPEGRLGGLVDHLAPALALDPKGPGGSAPVPGAAAEASAQVSARALLAALLDGLSDIWPGRLSCGGISLGDVWVHRRAGGEGAAAGFVPFHKLSQWLSYALVEPLAEAGLEVADLSALTGLAEYRNGGLFVDTGVLSPRHGDVTAQAHAPASEVVVEWRALTVALLDELVPHVNAALGRTGEAGGEPLSLAAMLEGGTWAAGRALAARLRPDGGPPIRIESDGTVF